MQERSRALAQPPTHMESRGNGDNQLPLKSYWVTSVSLKTKNLWNSPLFGIILEPVKEDMAMRTLHEAFSGLYFFIRTSERTKHHTTIIAQATTTTGSL